MKNLFISTILLLFFTPLLFSSSTKISLGFMPYLSSDVLLKKYSPLAEYLSKKIGQKVEIVIAKDYKTHIKNTGEDKIDISFLGGSPYVVIGNKYGKKPLLVRYEFDHKPFFRSAIIVGKNSKFNSLKDLKGKKFAFGNVNSTLSTQVPLFMLLNQGVSLKNLGYFKHLRNHENVVLGVAFEEFDAGAVAEEIFEENREKEIKVLGYSPEISTHVFVTRSTMESKLREKIQQALLDLKSEDILFSISKNLTGFSPVVDGDYDYHRVMLNRVLPVLGQK